MILVTPIIAIILSILAATALYFILMPILFVGVIELLPSSANESVTKKQAKKVKGIYLNACPEGTDEGDYYR